MFEIRSFEGAMMRGFSVDRRGVYIVGGALDLLPDDPSQSAIVEQPGRWAAQDLTDLQRSLFPQGLSRHGWQYLFLRKDAILGSDGFAYSAHEWMIELVFENYRLAHFPKRPSRFISYFAWQTIEQARAFKGPQQHIYELDGDGFVADQVWLTLGVQGIASYYNAEKYWSGAGSAKPRWEIVLPAPVQVTRLVEP
ncbi:hypothetical protein [Bradyrhizobium sp. AZCC 2230]|uniref:hypothetical protein n=1 Tax=Bradyrhizobium sp. AZCC 2230 TaxID=3117021 RepID=UPI002FEE9F73